MNEIKQIREAILWAIPYVTRLRDDIKLADALSALDRLEELTKRK